MNDLVFLGLVALLFALTWGLVGLVDRRMPRAAKR